MLAIKKIQFEDIRFDKDLIRQDDLREITKFSQGYISLLLNNKRSNPNSKRSKKETRKKLRDGLIKYHIMKGIPVEFVNGKNSN